MSYGVKMPQVDKTSALARVRTFVVQNFLYANPEAPLGDSDQLLESGIVDSMGVVELMEFIQGEFGVTIPDDDITEANLGSLEAIANYVSSRCAAAMG
jgi:acyl carrier protein